MKRREFLKLGGAAIVVGGAGGVSLFRPVAAVAASAAVELTMVEADHEMVDGVLVPGWAFESNLAAGGVLLGARIPGPTLFVTEGETLRIRVRNRIPNGGPHAFAIPGVVDSGPLAEDDEVEVAFTAPAAGTYLYLDPLNAPVNRVLGLHGAMVVLPPPVGHRTPYGAPTDAVRRLFDDLGTAAHFPGHFWDRDRNAVWVFATVDPDKHALAAASGGAIDPAAFTTGYLPQYFMINGKSGFFAAQHGHAEPPPGEHEHGSSGMVTPDAQAAISIHGNVGQPCLIRNLNAGMMTHSPHIHGNHVYRLADDGQVQEDLFLVDTWTMPPLSRKDVMVPYIKPPDIPGASWLRFEQGVNDELFPLLFPMHDHNEISNTAAGGNYPFGCVTHFQFDGPVDGHQEVIQIDRAELRLRTGQLTISGRTSGVALRDPAHNVLMVHAGPTATGPSLGTTVPAADGSWTFRGRALKALGSRIVTVHNHVTGAERAALPLTLR
jgi:hypothetical protein